MKELRMFYRILKITKTLEILYGFLFLFVISAFLLMYIEPTMHTLRDSLWFCFASVTTIGYGDLSASTDLGRIITVILSIYGIIFIAVVTGTIVSYVGELQRMSAKESVGVFLEKLEHLEELSKEELIILSEKIKSRKFEI